MFGRLSQAFQRKDQKTMSEKSNRQQLRIGMSNEYLESRIKRLDRRVSELVLEIAGLYNEQEKRIRTLEDTREAKRS